MRRWVRLLPDEHVAFLQSPDVDEKNVHEKVYRKLDPITSPKGELRFLAMAEALFLKGWQVGSDPEI
ncbi:hypothetical protein B0H14DRAFT_3500345 [Mycena olivaceomarginata]|nr:hypothetical protein B0H14DRAFT_3500345 [Mycena olivaceomarginata]